MAPLFPCWVPYPLGSAGLTTVILISGREKLPRGSFDYGSRSQVLWIGPSLTYGKIYSLSSRLSHGRTKVGKEKKKKISSSLAVALASYMRSLFPAEPFERETRPLALRPALDSASPALWQYTELNREGNRQGFRLQGLPPLQLGVSAAHPRSLVSVCSLASRPGPASDSG